MDVVAAVFADFVEASPGGPSQLRIQLGGQPILERTLRRLVRVEGVARRCLFVRERDREPAEQVRHAAGLDDRIDVLPLDTGQRTRRALLRAARKWNLDSWRGGLLGSTWFDEFVDPASVARVLQHYKCDAVFCFDGHQPLLDPRIATAMRGHVEENQPLARFVFTQAPPGLAGVILCRESLEQLLEFNIPFGLLLSYRPELAQIDPITQPPCYHITPEVAQTAARFTGDTRRSRELLAAALRELGDDATAEALCAWQCASGMKRAGPLPIEVELELTTDDALPNTTLRPRGERVPRRQVRDLAPLVRVAEELGAYDDRLVFVEGHGDPLQHPRFAEVCRALRAAGVYGIGVGTPLVDLSDEAFEGLFAQQIDVVQVRLDAHSAAAYQRVHGRDVYDRVVANMARIERRRREQSSPQPLIVPTLTRSAATIGELEAFYDRWIREVGSAVIEGYNEYCGVLPADTLLRTEPPVREACRRLTTRLVLLADGTVSSCGQDASGKVRLGDWTCDRLAEIWSGPALRTLRAAHADLDLEPAPLCQRCGEWFRP